jgi:metal-responsive CopG/Arc/MetJ family transcriptional regulator
MGATAKITISLDAELLEAIERQRRERGQTRSQFFRHAAEQALRREQEDDERYIEAYRRQPETEEEMLIAQQLGLAVLAQEPWDETW